MSGSEIIEAIVLGVIQGVTEFLPISSSGHLVIFGDLLRQATGREISPHSNLQMNVALHLGTLFSILLVYRTQLRQMLSDWRLLVAVALGTVPVVVAGLLLKTWIESELQHPLVAGSCLFMTAVMLVGAQWLERNQEPLSRLSWGSALIIGLFQAVALAPGISRSGATIAGGLLVGLRRNDATTFSFFIAIPAIAGAVLLTGWEIVQGQGSVNNLPVLVLGASTSFAVGCLALAWLIRIVAAGKLHWFAVYCAAVGLATILWQAW